MLASAPTTSDTVADLVPGNLLVDVVLEEVAKALLEPAGQPAELGLEDDLVEQIAHAETAPGHLCAVGWADAFLGCACVASARCKTRRRRHWTLTNHAAAQLDFLEAVGQLVDIENDMGAVGDEDAAVGVQAVLLERLEFLEEAGDVDDAAASDDVDAVGIDKATGENVEVVRDAVGDNGVAGVVTALGTAADLRLVGEDVGELALAFVAPLGAEDNGDRHREKTGNKRRGGDGAAGGFSICPWRSGLGRVSHGGLQKDLRRASEPAGRGRLCGGAMRCTCGPNVDCCAVRRRLRRCDVFCSFSSSSSSPAVHRGR